MNIQELNKQCVNIEVMENKQVVTATLNRPKAMNALNNKTFEELNMILDYMKANKEVRGFIITGFGKAFAAGADIKQMENYGAEEGRDYAAYAQDTYDRIENLEIPVIAAVNGYALGGGCELSMSCDIRIASETAIFSQPEVGLGLMPCFGGTQRLSRLVGVAKAKELIYTGRKIKADEAMSIGLVNKVVAAEELLAEAHKMMKMILNNASVAIKYSKIAINHGCEIDLHRALEFERDVCAIVFAAEDSKEGRKAFLEKRSPDFKNN